MRATLIRPSEIIVQKARWDELRSKARANDAYVRACRTMRARQVAVLDETRSGRMSVPEQQYAAGWLDALRTFGELVMEASRSDAGGTDRD